MLKLLGAAMILFGCSGIGFSAIVSHKRQEQELQQMIRAFDYISNELQYRLTSLPELCCGASRACSGRISNVFSQLSSALEAQIAPNAAACMHVVVNQNPDMTDKLHMCLTQLGETLGQFDLAGQLQGLESVKELAEFELTQLRRNQDVRLRSYRTLGMCAGAALVVLFL